MGIGKVSWLCFKRRWVAGMFISNGVGMHCTHRLPEETEADNELSSLRWQK